MNLEQQIEFFAKACVEIVREVEDIAYEDVCVENFKGILRAFANNILTDEDVPKETNE